MVRHPMARHMSPGMEAVVGMKRRTALAAMAGAGGACFTGTTVRADGRWNADALAAGPSAVILGNPRGDVTVAEFFDYQCPYCRRMQPVIRALLEDDPSLRLVHKHWPALGGGSILAARVALAARWQAERYGAVHAALMRLGGRFSEARIREAVAHAGLDMAALDRALATRAAEIDAALDEAERQARWLHLQGTPGYMVGRYVVHGAVGLAAMQRTVARARAAG